MRAIRNGSTVTYKVDTSDASNPKLIRTNVLTGAKETIADQIIGFKVGSLIKNNDSDFLYNATAADADFRNWRRVTWLEEAHMGGMVMERSELGQPKASERAHMWTAELNKCFR